MKGIALDTFAHTLAKVPDKHSEAPWDSFDILDRVGPWARRYIRANWPRATSFREIATYLPSGAFARLSFEEVCKVHYSSFFDMSRSLRPLFRDEADPQYSIVETIRLSMWQWGSGGRDWNALVDAYEGIRSFRFAPGFDVRLDHTTEPNERGSGRHSGIALDGKFAFLIYHRGEHVLTLGFSIARDRKLLVQQVQLAKRQGNRWLFKLPRPRLELALECFQAAFPRHALYAVDGESITRHITAAYRSNLKYYQELIDRDLRKNGKTSEYRIERKAEFEQKIAHLQGDSHRLCAFYDDIGCYRRGEALTINGVVHHALDRDPLRLAA